MEEYMNSMRGKAVPSEEKKKPTPEEAKAMLIGNTKDGLKKSLIKLGGAIISIVIESYIVKLLAAVVVPEHPLGYLQALCGLLLVRITLGSYKK